MLQKLYESQANDAYWHGLFGGLYLPHLRRAVYHALVTLEAMLDACSPRPPYFTEDTDLDEEAADVDLDDDLLEDDEDDNVSLDEIADVAGGEDEV